MANSNQGNQGKSGGKSQQSGTSNRGFASMDPERQREIAAEGGRAAHASGNAHEFTSEEARKAGSLSHKNDGNQQSVAAGGSRADSGGGNVASSAITGADGEAGASAGKPEQPASTARPRPKSER